MAAYTAGSASASGWLNSDAGAGRGVILFMMLGPREKEGWGTGGAKYSSRRAVCARPQPTRRLKESDPRPGSGSQDARADVP